MEFLRFLTVSVIGVLVDIAIGWLLSTTMGVPLWLAAAVGFATAAMLNYVLHRGWTFQRTVGMAEPARLLRYIATLGLTFVVRIVAVTSLSALFGPEAPALLILVPSVGISFAVSFLATKFLVFHSDDEGARDE
jgi:putative flippase GtrA